MKAERFGLSQLLRIDTASLHVNLEKLVDFEKLTTDRNHYVAILQAFLPVYQRLERQLESIFQGSDVLTRFPQNRSIRIARDLHALVVDTPPSEIHQPEISSTSAGFGTLYVLEGAAIGGQLISRSILANFGFSTSRGCEFFGSEGEDAGTRWRNFRLLLDSVPESEWQSAVAAAKDVFKVLEKMVRFKLSLVEL